MKKISVKELLETDTPLYLARSANGEDEGFDGACPCCIIYGEDFEVNVHCWRSSCSICEYSGIHVTGTIDKDLKQKIATHIKNNNGWSDWTDWNIIVE